MGQTYYQAAKKIKEALKNKNTMEHIIAESQKETILKFIEDINKMDLKTRIIFAWRVIRGTLGKEIKNN